MGCLIELIFDIFVEGIIELIGYCYIKLMQLIVPSKAVTDKTKRVVKIVATTVAAVLAITLIVGLFLIIQEDPLIHLIGEYLVFIPLSIMVLQISLGIVAKIISHFRK